MPQVARAANVFKTSSAAGGSGTAVLWTPASGKRFRVLKWWIELSGNAAAATAGSLTVSLTEGATQVGLSRTVSLPSTAGDSSRGNLMSLAYDIGPLGYLAAAPDTVLTITLAAALTSGLIRVSVAGTEE